MTRANIYALIDKERAAQDLRYPNRTQYKYSAPHIVVLGGQLAKLEADWYNNADRDTLLERFINIAAIAVRALEEIEIIPNP